MTIKEGLERFWDRHSEDIIGIGFSLTAIYLMIVVAILTIVVAIKIF